MRILLKGSLIVPILQNYLHGVKTMFNLKTEGDKLLIQVLEDYTMETSIPYEVLENDGVPIDHTVSITKIVQALNKGNDVEVSFDNSIVFFKQKSLEFSCVKEYESRRDFGNITGEWSPYPSARIAYLRKCLSSMFQAITELKLFFPDPVFYNKHFYCISDKTAFVESANAMCDVCIPYEILKKVSYVIRGKSEYFVNNEKSVLVVQSGSSKFYIPTMPYNMNINSINGINKILSSLKYKAIIDINKYVDQLEIISKVFEKKTLTFSIGNDCFYVLASGSDMRVIVGDEVNVTLMSMSITAGQLNTIVSLFGELSEVEVLGGSNCICLKVNEKSLLISGMIY